MLPAPAGPVLDFGSATGELCALLRRTATGLSTERRLAEARELEGGGERLELPRNTFMAVFALISEHNEDVEPALDRPSTLWRITAYLSCRGQLRIGWQTRRRIAGFDGLSSSDNP
jgi:hypothetical protein